LDQAAINTYGIADELLMENAGGAAFNVLRQRYGIAGRQIAIVCGAGNNGGDGLVVARKIHVEGGTPKLFILGDPKRYRSAAALNWRITQQLPMAVQRIERAAQLEPALVSCDAVVDAIFGTGLARDVEGRYAETIDLINSSGLPVLSIDIPSGVNGNSGAIMGIAIRADATVTFGLPKYGNLLYPGAGQGGDLYVSHISFPPEMHAKKEFTVALNRTGALPARDPDGHKQRFGDLLCIAGAASYYGAPHLAAYAFLKAGGGFSRLACPAAMVPHLAAMGPEIVYMPMQATVDHSLALENKQVLLEKSEEVDMVVIGPGVSLQPETVQLVQELCVAIDKPLLIDGDGLTAVAQKTELLKHRRAPTVLTPHVGEMARLTGQSKNRIFNDKVGVLQDFAQSVNATVVLKGAHSLIGLADGRVYINLSGNSGMATAGSGDVLTGTIAAMHALGLTIEAAVCKGVFIHGVAGDVAAMELGEDGLVAKDIAEFLPKALRLDRWGYPTKLSKKYNQPIIV
jgi:NAD(P)H-hydrate epimerase